MRAECGRSTLAMLGLKTVIYMQYLRKTYNAGYWIRLKQLTVLVLSVFIGGYMMSEIIVLRLQYKYGDMEEFIHPVIIRDDNEMVLVDCGYVGFMPVVEEAMKEKGLDCSRLTKILITHQDHDHMGALAAFKEKYSHIKIAASETEAPYISGERKSLRLEQAEAMQATLSEENKAFGIAFCNLLRSIKPVKVDILVHDGERLDWCGGCSVIATPGHTPGHISLYFSDKRTIIAGDAAVVENNKLVVANPQFTLDIDRAKEDIAKLLRSDAETYICYHGGVYRKLEE